MLPFLKHSGRSPFLQHIITLVTGAAVAQIVPLLASPLITRLYTPQAVGVQAVYVSWLSSLAVLATARYEMAIVLPAEETKASNLMGLSLLCSFAPALLVGVVLALDGHAQLADYLGTPELEDWLLLMPLSLLLAGLMQALDQLEQSSPALSGQCQRPHAAVVQHGLSTQVVGGLLGGGAGGLILGQFA
ncbi:lipopolysaccharide biosynthesis protein [Paludibacterium denitrificans]|uniref:Polysaccharide biosynthesis protein n=1 Tax=Paludibacterium denitrificans TaxID=2675226 RepID=A0A844G914_9NEIS|nr:hypothetical protein [Paludibacterium denitrificans]MTD32896.1 hypothetical protein [Paludibacterium denitrificans]